MRVLSERLSGPLSRLPAPRPPACLPQWEELIERCQEAGVDAFEINFSCPHGMPERKMGMAMGQVGGWSQGAGAGGLKLSSACHPAAQPRSPVCTCLPACRVSVNLLALIRADLLTLCPAPWPALWPALDPGRTARSCTRSAAGSTPSQPSQCGQR